MTSSSPVRGRTRTTALAALSAGLCGVLALTGCTHHTSRTKTRHGISKHRTSSTSTRSSSSASVCRVTSLTFSLYQRPNKDGRQREVLQARNKSHSTCALRYRPLVAFTKKDPFADKHPLPANEDSSGFLGTGRVTLSPGRSAYASFPAQNSSGKGTLISEDKQYIYVSPGAVGDRAPSWHEMYLGHSRFRVAGTPSITYWSSSQAGALAY